MADTFQKTFTRNKTHRHFLYIQCADLIGLPIKQEINQICMYKVLLASLLGEFDSTSEIPFMFKRAGCDVDIFCASGSWLRSNKFHDKWIETTEIHEDFKTRLLKLVESNPEYYNWIVLLDDAAIRLMNEEINSEYLFKKILPLTKIENREMLSSKIGLSKICEKYSIATPRFINYSDEHDIEKIAQKLDFPILLKENFSFSGIGIQYCADISLLKTCFDKVKNKTNLVLQEFIEGDDIGVEALFKECELITYNCAEILAYMHNKFSFTTRRLYYQSEEIAALLKVLGKQFGLNGFASIQYIYHKERKIYYLLEVDARTNMWMPYSRFTEHDFSNGINKIIRGDIYNINEAVSTKKVEIAIFDRDLRRCVKYKDYKGMLQWLFNYKGYWRFIRFYDLIVLGRTTKKMCYDFYKKIF